MKDKCKCKIKYCRRVKAKGRSICDHHIHEIKRNKNPARYCYGVLRRNARRRGKVFDLTFEQFACFCIETNYIKGKGRSRTSLTIDCIDPEKGYTISNIRALPNSENARKSNKKLIYDWQNGTAFVQDISLTVGDGPF